METVNAKPSVFILGAARTPTGKFCGRLKDFSAVDLGARAVAGVLKRFAVSPRDVEEVILGQVLQAGCGQNPARQAALKAGLPNTIAAFTVNKCCGSGLKAVLLAAAAIKAGDGDLFVAGGMESMSQAPYLLDHARRGLRLGNGEIRDSILADGLLCPFCRWHMGNAAEFIAKKFRISRKEQDRYALQSHRRAILAQRKGLLVNEILPIVTSHDAIRQDETPRPDTSIKVLGRLPAAFQPHRGTVTAGNAPGLSDGAAALILASENFVRRRKARPMARIVDYVAIGVEPSRIFTAPALAAKALLKKMGAGWRDFDLVEANEAFAAQALASQKLALWDPRRVNVHGGAIALGHPLGASGARILVTLIHALRVRKKKSGLATICMGGGNGLAVAIEML